MQRKIEWIEVCRTLGMVLVVFVHCFEHVSPPEFKANHLLETTLLSEFIRYVVPMFFFISGFLLCRSSSRTRGKHNALSFLNKKFGALVIPFLVWNAIYVLNFYFLFPGGELFSGRNIFSFLTGFMHLYYVAVLIQFFLLYAFFGHLFKGRALSVMMVLATLGSLGFYAVSEGLLWGLRINDHHVFEWTYGKLFVAWGLFFFWGAWCYEHRSFFEKIGQKYLPGLGVCSALVLVPYYFEMDAQRTAFGGVLRDYFLLSGLAYQFLMCTFVVALFSRLERNPDAWIKIRFLARYGKDTYGVYLVHVLFMVWIALLWDRAELPETMLLKIPGVTILTWLCSLYFTRACRLPGLHVLNRVLFGARRTS